MICYNYNKYFFLIFLFLIFFPAAVFKQKFVRYIKHREKRITVGSLSFRTNDPVVYRFALDPQV